METQEYYLNPSKQPAKHLGLAKVLWIDIFICFGVYSMSVVKINK